jgi:2-polyprenyl-3-methyl-5-hydroxy-6-metoxy-1,4-benzoquinol methylase
MKKIERNKDVIYGNEDLEHIYTFKDFPVFMGCTDKPESEDIKADMSWYISKGSGMIQLNPLLPLDVVYVDEHGSGTVGKSWDDHHQAFAEFVCKHNVNKVLEIGGLHGILSKKSQAIKDIDWTIIEPNPIVSADIDAKIIQGFFDENFTSDDKYDTVIHSHVLEHVYDPAKFMDHISSFIESGLLIFSVPNMDKMMEKKYTNCVNFEHTVLLGEVYIKFLLEMYGFEIVEKEYYKEDHSIFYCAKRTHSEADVVGPPISSYIDNSKSFNAYIEHHIEDVKEINKTINNTDVPIYLFGAHVFSQYLIAFGLDTTNIVCLLDNDASKVGKRLYGTGLTSYIPSSLKDVPEAIVILRAGVYNDEIKTDIINNINPNVKFI